MEKTIKTMKGFGISLMIFVVMVTLFALLLKTTGLPEKLSFLYVLISMSLATLFLGVFLGHLTGGKGLIYGFLGALLFTFIIFYTLNVFFNQPLQFQLIHLRYLVPIFFGGIGGVIGVNMRN